VNKIRLLGLCCFFSYGLLSAAHSQENGNFSFENDLQGWSQPRVERPHNPASFKPGDGITLSNEHVRHGNKSLQFTANSFSPRLSITTELQPLPQSNFPVTLRTWYFYEGAWNRKFGGKVRFYNAGREEIPNSLVTGYASPKPNGEWFPLNIQLAGGPAAAFYSLELFWEAGNGKVTFDDIQILTNQRQPLRQTGYSLPSVAGFDGQLWMASSMEKVYPGFEPPATQGQNLALSVARGESRSVQLVYRPRAASQSLSLSMGALQGRGGQGTLPASTVEVRYIDTIELKEGKNPGLTPDPLLATPTLPLQPNTATAALITVTAPRDAKSGEYTTRLTVKSDEGEYQVPLQVTVFDFTLPEKPTLKTTAASSPIHVPARPELRRQLLANRITAEISYGGGVQSMSEVKVNPDYTVSIDWAAWDAIMEAYFAQGFEYFYVPNMHFGQITGINRGGEWLGKVKYGTPEWEKVFDSYVSQMYVHLQEKGWLKYGLWRIWDEPMGTEVRAITDDIVTRTRKLAPEAKIHITGWPIESTKSDVSIWCPQMTLFSPELRKISNSDFWIYNNGLYIMDSPYNLIQFRDFGWYMWANNVKGHLWWSTTYGWNSALYTDPTPYGNQNGQGFLFYPGKDGNKDVVNPSLRLTAYRDSVNDYDYFTLLAAAQDTAVQKASLSGKAPTGRELVQELMAEGLGKFDPSQIEKGRLLAAGLIVFLKNNPSVALKLEPDFWQTKTITMFGEAKSQTIQLPEYAQKFVIVKE
jgi:hypothetical protein